MKDLHQLYNYFGIEIDRSLKREAVKEHVEEQLIEAFKKNPNEIWKNILTLNSKILDEHIINSYCCQP